MYRKNKMEKKGQSQRHQSTSIPGLIRSRSGTSSSSDQNQIYNIMPTKKSNPKEGVQQLKRSTSTTKSTTLKERFHQQRIHESKDDNLRMLQRTQTKIEVQRKARSACTSPSAWALSSGRSSPSPSTAMSVVKPRGGLSPGRGARVPGFSPVVSVPKSPSSGTLLGRKNSGGKVLSGFWNFLKQKKVSPEEEEEYHQFRLMQTRLVQWRFANARAEASMNVMKRVAQKKMFNVWVRNSIIRNQNVEKRIQIQNIKQEMKLCKMLNSQFDLLKEWSRLEGKNSEALGRLARKLSAISTCIPLVNGAKADITSMYEAFTNANRVLEGIKVTIENIGFILIKLYSFFWRNS
ncbi:hypothetical protein Leryth_009847 [Lithospermum erythrorhizon]|nr:hypothetical protein Leryth_009847 [Lithospermum erythrorhizon]